MSVALRSSVTRDRSAGLHDVREPKLTLAAYALVGIPLTVLPIVLAGRRMQKLSRASQDRIADANALRQRNPGRGAHGAGARARAVRTRPLRTAVAVARRNGAQAHPLRRPGSPRSSIMLIFGAITLVLWSGAHDVIAGRMSAGTLGQFVLYALIGGGSVGALAEVWNELQRAAGGMGRINELLEETPGVTASVLAASAAAARARRDCASMTSLSTIPMRPDLPALERFSLQVKPGETVALVGPSGAGKSTVFSLLLRFHDPQSGTISVDGVDIRETGSGRAARTHRAGAAGSPMIFAASARDNIRYGRLEADDAAIEAAARAAEAHEFLVGAAERLRRRTRRTRRAPVRRAAAARRHRPRLAARTRRYCCWTKPPPRWMRKASAPCSMRWNG